MIRKLALAVSLAIGGLCVPVHALGLGEITPRSALNQNFDADIKLLSVKSDELDSVRVGLASNEDFMRAGVERPYYLSQLKFKPVALNDGKTVVRVTSDQPVREPFLNFLVEVNWPKGRMVREYTTLLDPPTTTLRRPSRIKVASASRSVPISRTPRKTAPAKKAAVNNGQYGPITNSDTAWSIAKRFRHQGVTMAQMLMALLKANPDAFIDNNINHMRNGAILRIPSKQEVLDWDRQSAQQAFREQQDEWLAKRTQALRALPDKAKAEDVTIKPLREPEGRLRIATTNPSAEKKAGSGGAEGGTKNADLEDLKTKLATARENAETSRQESDSLRNRMDDLEARLADMQRLLQLKDEQLAQLQDRIAQRPVAEPVVEQPVISAPVIDEPREIDLNDPLDQVMQDAMQQDEIDEPINPATVVQPEPEPEIVEPIITPPEISEPEPKKSKSSDWIPMAAAGGGVIALLAGLLAWRRRKNQDEESDRNDSLLIVDDEPATLDQDTDTTKPIDDVDDLFGDELVSEIDKLDQSTGDSSFLSEFSPSEINALNDETGEVDPVSEADVYLAYGRYQQAEDLLKQAIDRDPERAALSHKLAEVYYATRDKDAFAALASTMASNGLHESDPEAWNKITDMGRELVPSHALFAVTEIDDDFGADEFDQLLDDMDDVDVAMDTSAASEPVQEDIGLDNLEDDIDDLGLESPIDEDSLALGEFELSELSSDFLPDGEVGKPEENKDLRMDVISDFADDLENNDLEPAPPSAAELEAEEMGLSEFQFGEEDTDSYEDPIGSTPIPTDMGVPSLDVDTDTTSDLAVPTESELKKVGANSNSVDLDSDIDGELLDLADIETASEDNPLSDFNETIDSIPAFDTDSGVADLQAQLDELSDLAGLGDDYSSSLNDSDLASKPISESTDSPASLDDAFESAEHGDPADDLASFGADDPLMGGDDEVATKLDLASAYLEMGDPDGAKSILDEVYAEGSEEQKAQADKLMAQISS